MTPLETWLATATHGLAPDSIVRVGDEIKEHYESAIAAGRSPAQAVSALGDPVRANRAYRRVLLTAREAIMAPTLMRTNRGSWAILLQILAPLVFAWLQRDYIASYTLWDWTFWILFWIDVPARLLFPPLTKECSRNYLAWSIARLVILGAIALQDVHRPGGLVTFILCLPVYIDYQRWTIFRKLAGAPAPSAPILLAHPTLTRSEAFVLQTLYRGDEPGLLFFALLAVASYWLPATAGPLTAAMAFGFLLPRFLPLYTPARSRTFRWAKWTALAIAAILPVALHALVPWTGAAFIAVTFWVFEAKRISLRSKLPVEEWPKELYL